MIADFLRLIDVNAGSLGLKKGQGILHLTLQNYYTHEILIFELFQGLQIQLSEVCEIHLCYSYRFLVLFLLNAVTENNSPQAFS